MHDPREEPLVRERHTAMPMTCEMERALREGRMTEAEVRYVLGIEEEPDEDADRRSA